MPFDMQAVRNHKVAIVVIGGVALGAYFLMSSGSGSSGSSGSSSGSNSNSGYYNALNSQYQNMLMSQSLSNQAQAQSEATVAATQIGLAQQKTARQANNLTALAYTAAGIDQVLMNQNSNQAGLYAVQSESLAGLGSNAYGPLAKVNISSNELSQSYGTGSFSGFGMNIHSGSGNAASG